MDYYDEDGRGPLTTICTLCTIDLIVSGFSHHKVSKADNMAVSIVHIVSIFLRHGHSLIDNCDTLLSLASKIIARCTHTVRAKLQPG